MYSGHNMYIQWQHCTVAAALHTTVVTFTSQWWQHLNSHMQQYLKIVAKAFVCNDDTAMVAVTATLQIPAIVLAHNGNIFTYSSSNVYTQWQQQLHTVAALDTMAAKLHRIVVICVCNGSNSGNYLCNCYVKLWVGLGQGDSTAQFYQQLNIVLVPCGSLFVYYFLVDHPYNNDISCHTQYSYWLWWGLLGITLLN